MLEDIKDAILSKRSGSLSADNIIFPKPEIILGKGAQAIVKQAVLSFTGQIIPVAVKIVQIHRNNAISFHKEVTQCDLCQYNILVAVSLFAPLARLRDFRSSSYWK
jgi:hypothetical protein